MTEESKNRMRQTIVHLQKKLKDLHENTMVIGAELIEFQIYLAEIEADRSRIVLDDEKKSIHKEGE